MSVRPARAPLAVLALLGALTGLLGAGVASAPPAAAESVQWTVAPRPTDEGGRANYGYVLDPGAVVQDALVVTNRSETPLVLGVYAADGFTTDTGQLDVLPTGTPSTDLGSWVQLAASTLELAPGEQVEVPFTLTVPADAAAGDHSGAVLTSLVTDAGESGVSIDRRLGLTVHTLVNGELTAGMQVTDLAVDYDDSPLPFAGGTATVHFTLTNTGNTRIAAEQVVRLHGPLGLGTRTVTSTATPELLAGASIPVSVPVDGVAPLGRLTAEVALVPAVVGATGVSAEPVVASTPVTALGWTTLLLLAVVLGGAGWWAWHRRRRLPFQPLPPLPSTRTPDPVETAP